MHKSNSDLRAAARGQTVTQLDSYTHLELDHETAKIRIVFATGEASEWVYMTPAVLHTKNNGDYIAFGDYYKGVVPKVNVIYQLEQYVHSPVVHVNQE